MERFLRDSVLATTAQNVTRVYNCNNLPTWARQSIDELVDRRLVDEINNRFFRTLEFGTGGMRSRTIPEVVTSPERGNSKTNRPDFAAVGTAYLNDFNIIGATIALFRYCSKFLKNNNRAYELPSVVISYDVRHFSKHFGELAASTWKNLGGHAILYASPRSTPQLSFSVRHLSCTAGIMITASHNPWHDNGFKAYFLDGAQMVNPHASGVISEFNSVAMDDICRFCQKDMSGVTILDELIDVCYQSTVTKTILRRDFLENYPIRVVFSPLHGTGGVATIPLLEANKISHSVVEEQNDQDPNFSTVKSPNPENKEALGMSIALAKKDNADLVLATDPDGDRLAIAAKNSSGEFEVFTGNVTGALLTEYRISQLKFLRKIPVEGSKSVAVVKTFVTTPLIDKIANSHGIKCINTLTGFKWIGEKMFDYENRMLEHEYESTGISINYDKTLGAKRDDLLKKNSTLFIFGCEESYGCLSANNVRDKDANSACLMACELAAYAKSFNKTLIDLRDDMYVKYGYFGESVLNIYYEGADGAQKIKNILTSYQKDPPKQIDDGKVTEIVDFSKQTIQDADGKVIPSQQFFFITLKNGVKFALRASGTEPKIKFYLFAEVKIDDRSQIEETKKATSFLLERMKRFLKTDVDERANFVT
ncbi:MAG: phospho-sugar mutase [Puniceicoccales bacterium]|jgi:phosphoglucomutase|nr:phospho-sugar mutase [Puniceicoccales bacterium]